jgi:hypothetical protein
MRRSTVFLIIVAILAICASAAGAAKPPAGPSAATRALARASFAPFRHAPRATDRIPAALLTATQRKRLRGADTRRVAAGSGWAAYLALEPRVPGQGFHPVGHLEVLAVGKALKTDGPPSVLAVRQVATAGSWTTFTPSGGARTTVAVVPDGAVAARLLSGHEKTATPVAVSGNAIVVSTPGSATVSWRRATGGWINLGVVGAIGSATPVLATLLDGSHVTLDLGGGVVRTIPISGAVSGSIAGGYRLNRDNTITLTEGTIAVAPTDLLTDDCAGPAIASTTGPTNVTLDPAKPSTAVVGRDGTVTANLAALLHAVLALRQPNGCGAPTVTSGVADTALGLALGGKLVAGSGLARLQLTSAPTPVTVQACLSPGDPSQACAQPTAVPATMTADVTVNVRVG